MLISSRRLVAQISASAAAVIVAAMPIQGTTSSKAAQPGVQMVQPSAGGAIGVGGQRAASLPSVKTQTDRRLDPDVMHHWYP